MIGLIISLCRCFLIGARVVVAANATAKKRVEYNGKIFIVDAVRRVLKREATIDLTQFQSIRFARAPVNTGVMERERYINGRDVVYPFASVAAPMVIMSVPAGVVFVSIVALNKILAASAQYETEGSSVYQILDDKFRTIVITVGTTSAIAINEHAEIVLSVMDLEYSIGSVAGIYIRRSHLNEIVARYNKYVAQRIFNAYGHVF